MELNYSKIFNKETLSSVESFCKLNNIDDVDSFIKNVFQEGFNIKKYGLLGKTLNEGEKDLKTGGIEEKRVEIEVIREIRVEVPVEVIKEVEKIVTKIEYISDKNGETELLLKIQQLEEERQIFSTKIADLEEERQIFSTKTEEMENNFQNEISKKDKELGDLRQKLDDPVTNDKIKLLQETLQNLRGEIQQKNEQIREIEKINRDLLNGNQNQAYLLRGSNLNKRV